jgi:4-diphosphocytidyl-2-C-methyl-D-erythritol kinase
MCFMFLFPEPPAFEVLPSLKRLKKRVIAASQGDYSAVFMSGR